MQRERQSIRFQHHNRLRNAFLRLYWTMKSISTLQFTIHISTSLEWQHSLLSLLPSSPTFFYSLPCPLLYFPPPLRPLSFFKERLPHTGPHFDGFGVLEAWPPYVFLKVDFESLFGGPSMRMHLLIDPWPNKRPPVCAKLPFCIRPHTGEGACGVVVRGEGGQPSSEPDQWNWPRQSVRWQICTEIDPCMAPRTPVFHKHDFTSPGNSHLRREKLQVTLMFRSEIAFLRVSQDLSI